MRLFMCWYHYNITLRPWSYTKRNDTQAK